MVIGEIMILGLSGASQLAHLLKDLEREQIGLKITLLSEFGAPSRCCLWPNTFRGSFSDYIQNFLPWGFAS